MIIIKIILQGGNNMKQLAFLDGLKNGLFDSELSMLYGEDISYQKERYSLAVSAFGRHFSADDIRVFSAPGRTEIGGNHTDHQCGCALAAAVSLDMIAVVSFNSSGMIRLYSEGYGMTEISVEDTSVRPEEAGTTAALIRGIVSCFAGRGVKIGGFDAYSVSDVPGGSGLSSSAAFETLIATVINIGYDFGTGVKDIAKFGQYAENVYFGKGSGLLDQAVCAAGGLVFLDFKDPDEPLVSSVPFDFDDAGLCICITDTKGSHSDLTEDYTAVPSEMKEVASLFGKNVLREVDKSEFFTALPSLYGKVSDRAILRAVHFFGENKRAQLEAHALRDGDTEAFLALYRSSARSSTELLQNLYPCSHPERQGIPLGIMLSRHILGEDCNVRVHGGGFAGTVQAIVPKEKAAEYVRSVDLFFGSNSCHILRVRPVGGTELRGGT